MQKMKLNLRSISAAVSGALLVALVLGIGSSLWAQDANPLTLDTPLAFDTPTYSSPIALDANKNLLWVVNPDDDTVSVIGNLDSTLDAIGRGGQPDADSRQHDGSRVQQQRQRCHWHG